MQQVETERNHNGQLMGEYGGRRVIDCQICNFAHLDPLPSAETVRALYERNFYQDFKRGYFAESTADAEWLRATQFAIELHWLTHIRQSLELPGTGRLLDVGCGGGEFLAYAREQGWNVKGLDPSPLVSTVLKEKHIPHTQAFFDDYEDGGFDVVRMAWVLEHLLDPRAALKKAYDILTERGILLLIVPNDFSAMQRAARYVLGGKDYWIHPTHINYFSPARIARLLADAGFVIRASRGTYPMELFLLMGLDYVADPALGKVAHGYRKALEQNLARAGGLGAIDQLYVSCSVNGGGRDLIFWAIKLEGNIK